VDFRARFYPELPAGGFPRGDGAVELFSRVHALLQPESRVLDFGAGRGWSAVADPNLYRRRLADLRGHCASVVGIDADEAVLTNPTLDDAFVVAEGDPLPFDDESFHLIICDSVFEHLSEPTQATTEMARVLKPGGWICGRTPNRRGYIALGARIVPNRLHVRALRHLQPDRQAVDVFPTSYRVNTRRALEARFPVEQFEHCTFGINTEPAYVPPTNPAWVLLWAWGKVAPEPLCATWMVFMRKRDV
jgi:SAM-dependent methyltransferase